MVRSSSWLRSFRFLFLKKIADLVSSRRIDCGSADLYMPDLSFLVDDECRASGVARFLVVESVVFGRLPLPVAQQRERHRELLCKCFSRRKAIHTYAQHLSFGCVEFGDISLIRLELLRSAACESEDVEGEYDRFLAAKVGELNRFAPRVRKTELRRHIADLKMRRWSFRRRLCECGNGDHARDQECDGQVFHKSRSPSFRSSSSSSVVVRQTSRTNHGTRGRKRN